MPGQYQDVMFFVFIGFFIVIGVASLSALLGFPKTPDRRFRQWAIPGFLAGVTTAIFGLFRASFLTTLAPIVVTLLPPADATLSPLKSGVFQYDEAAPDDQTKVVTRTGTLSPVLGQGGTWEVRLPGEVASNPTRLHLQDENGSWWTVGPFFPNYVSKEMRTGKPFVPGSQTSWRLPGIAVVSAAEPAREKEQAGVRFNNYSRRIADRYERPFYEWRVFVDEPSHVLDTIVQVDYALHPSFPEPFQSSTDRGRKFELTASGWGEFTILVTVHYANGRQVKTTHPLTLKPNWPVEPQKRAESTTRVILEKIQVQWDGSPGSTGWVFDIFLDGKPVLRLPNRDYDDARQRTKKGNEYLPDANRRIVGAVSIASDRAVRIDVKGTRSFGGDTASGTASLQTNRGSVPVVVENSQSPRKGSFVFHFAALPI